MKTLTLLALALLALPLATPPDTLAIILAGCWKAWWVFVAIAGLFAADWWMERRVRHG